MELNWGSIISVISAIVVAIIGYFLIQKDKALTDLKNENDDQDKRIAALESRQDKRVGDLELKYAVQQESNRHRDDRSERIEHKLDRLLDKLGA